MIRHVNEHVARQPQRVQSAMQATLNAGGEEEEVEEEEKSKKSKKKRRRRRRPVA